MAIIEANPRQLIKIRRLIEQKLDISSNAEIMDEWYGIVVSEKNLKVNEGLNLEGPDNNKYFYVVLYDDTLLSGDFVACACWGRIGSKYVGGGKHRVAELYRGDDLKAAKRAALGKINQKKRKYKKAPKMPWGF